MEVGLDYKVLLKVHLTLKATKEYHRGITLAEETQKEVPLEM